MFGKITTKKPVSGQKQNRTVEKIERKIKEAYERISVLDAGTPFQEALSKLEDTAIELKKKCGMSYVSGTKIGTFGDLLNKKK